MISVLAAYNKLQGLPMGKYIFSKAVCMKAPYFNTIRPRFAELRSGYGRITMKNRRAVQNHLNSVHAIAMCNLCELTEESPLTPHCPLTSGGFPAVGRWNTSRSQEQI